MMPERSLESNSGSLRDSGCCLAVLRLTPETGEARGSKATSADVNSENIIIICIMRIGLGFEVCQTHTLGDIEPPRLYRLLIVERSRRDEVGSSMP